MKKTLLLTLLSAGIVGLGATAMANRNVFGAVVNADGETAVLYYKGAADDGFSEPLKFHQHVDGATHQEEGLFYFDKDDVFKVKTSNGKWAGYHSALSANFSDADGDHNIKCKTSGLYSIWFSTDIYGYDNANYIWNGTGAITQITDMPSLQGSFDGAAWGAGGAFSWDATSHRLKITKHLSAGDEFKIKKDTDDERMAGFHENMKLHFNLTGETEGNITVQKSGTYSIYLGASFTFFGKGEYGFVADPSSDNTAKEYYNSYITVSYTDAEAAASFATTVNLIKNKGDVGGCEGKYTLAQPEFDALTVDQLTIVQASYKTEYDAYQTWLEYHNTHNNTSVVVTPELTSDSSFAVIAGVAIVSAVTLGGLFLLRKKSAE